MIQHLGPTQLKHRVQEMVAAVERDERIETDAFLALLTQIIEELDALWQAVENPLVHVEPSTGGAGRP